MNNWSNQKRKIKQLRSVYNSSQTYKKLSQVKSKLNGNQQAY